MLEITEILSGVSAIALAFIMFVLYGFKADFSQIKDDFRGDFKEVRKDFSDIKDSITDLNSSISTLIANDASKDKEMMEIKMELVRLRDKIHNGGTFMSILDGKIKSLEMDHAALMKMLAEK